jgi:hypothetical protein
LRSFFVNDRTRRFFVPLSNWQNKSAFAIETVVRESLSGMPVSSIIIPRNAQSALSRVCGMIEKTALLAALLITCVFVILPFFKDFLSDLAYRSRKIRRANMPLFVSLFLITVLIASSIAGDGISIRTGFVIALPVLFLAAWILPAWLRQTAALRRRHVIFRPVFVRGVLPRPKRHGPPTIVLGLFGIAALALAVSFFAGSTDGGPAGFSTGGFSNEDYGDIVSEDDYHAHDRHETLFSYLPLWAEHEEDAPPYRRYAVDADGLYAAAETIPEPETAIPPYPFERLAAFTDGAGLTMAAPPKGGLLFFIALAGLLPFVILRTRHEDL